MTRVLRPFHCLLFLLSLGLLVQMPSLGSAQELTCSTNLRPINGGMGYRLRKRPRRCEGLYTSTISARLQVVSLLRGQLNFNPTRHQTLWVSAPDVQSGAVSPIWVRALALHPKTYYQMDAQLPDNGVMEWPMRDVLAKAQLDARGLGVFGWIGSEDDKEFVPLAVSSEKRRQVAREKKGPIRLTIRTPVDIEKLVFRWYSAGVEGGKRSEWQKLEGVSVHAGGVITIPLPTTSAPVARVEVAAKKVNVEKWLKLNLRLWQPSG